MHSDTPDLINPSLPAQSPRTRARARSASFIAILFLAALAASGCVIHDRGHHRSAHRSGSVVIQPRVAVTTPAPITFTFSKHHRHAAHNYYHDHPRRHGKKHKWKKRWRHKRKSHLHRDIQIQAIPYDLVRQFPPAPRGTQYIYDDDQVLLVDMKTRVVLDFINISVSVGAPIAVAPAPVVFTFSDHHRHSVQNYYHRHPYHHGKKHKHKKKWRYKRKSRLHRGAQMQMIPFELVSQLPPAPYGTRYIYDFDQVLLVDVNTREVLDFINISLSAGAPMAVAPAPVVFTFTDHHSHSVRNYYHEHPRHHGKKHKWKKKKKRKHKKRGRGRDRHPHGWVKHDVLPQEIQIEAVPVDLVRELPHPPHGTQYTYHEDQVLLIDLSTRIVLDFINISISAGY